MVNYYHFIYLSWGNWIFHIFNLFRNVIDSCGPSWKKKIIHFLLTHQEERLEILAMEEQQERMVTTRSEEHQERMVTTRSEEHQRVSFAGETCE